MAKVTLNDNGKFDAYAWPGGHPIFYVTKDGACLCTPCANGENGSDASLINDDPQWQIIACDINYENARLYCEHCDKRIESAYAEPETERRFVKYEKSGLGGSYVKCEAHEADLLSEYTLDKSDPDFPDGLVMHSRDLIDFNACNREAWQLVNSARIDAILDHADEDLLTRVEIAIQENIN